MPKILYFLIPVVFIFLFVFLIFSSNKSSSSSINSSGEVSGVSSVGDKQIIDITAKGGYSPNTINAKAGVESELHVKTVNTYDCSLALRIPDLNVNEILSQNGTKIINIPPQKPNSSIVGSCSMGMYGFKINFK